MRSKHALKVVSFLVGLLAVCRPSNAQVEQPPGAPSWWGETSAYRYAFAKWPDSIGQNYSGNPPNDPAHWDDNYPSPNNTDFKIEVNGKEVTVTLGNEASFNHSKNIYIHPWRLARGLVDTFVS